MNVLVPFMSPHPTQAPQHHPAQPNPAQSAATQRQALDDLVTMGTNLARLLHDQAVAQAAAHAPAPKPSAQPPTPNTLIPLTNAFAQIARAVRRCILLARLLDRPAQPAPDPAHHRTAARKRILREVEDEITRTHNPGSDIAEDLQAELLDRLDAPDLQADLATRPVADIIAEIRRDLGVASLPGSRHWRRRTPADLADLHARAAAPTPAPSPGPAHGPAPGTTPPDQPASPRAPVPPQAAAATPWNPAAFAAAVPQHPIHASGGRRPPPDG